MPGRLGDLLKTLKGVAPQSAAAGSINGESIDRDGYNYAVIALETGAASGTPSATDVDLKVQESDDGSSWTDVSGAVISDVGADSRGELNLDLRGLKKYIRAVVTVTFTGGTSPAVPVAATVVIGEPVEGPK